MKLGCFFLFFMFIWSVVGQQILPIHEEAYSDSLTTILKSEAPDSTYSRVHFLLSDFYRSKDTVLSLNHLKQGDQYGGSYPFFKGLYHFYYGQFYFGKNRDKAAFHFKRADSIFENFQTKEALNMRSVSIFNYGIMTKDKTGDDYLVDLILNKAVPLVQKTGNSKKEAHYFSQLGTLFMYSAKFDKAEEYIDRAIELLEDKHPDASELLLAYLGAASNYIYQAKGDEAKSCLDKAKKLLPPNGESVNYSLYYYNESLYFLLKGDYKRSLQSLEKGIEKAKALNQNELLQLMRFKKYENLLALGKYHEAKQILLELVSEKQFMYDSNNKKVVYQQLASVNATLGNMEEAYQWSTKYAQLNDSIHQARSKENMETLEAKFKKVENEKKITTLEAQNREAALEATNNRLIIYMLLGLTFLLILIVLLIKLNHTKSKKLAIEKEGSYQAQLEKLKQEQQLLSVQAMLKGEERERKRMAQDLHDGLGGILAGVRMNLSEVESKVTQTFQTEIDKIITNVDVSLRELRRIAHNLMPETLLRVGLVNALEDLCKSYQKSGVNIEFQAYEMNAKMSDNEQLTIYRIIQELLSNSLRHSKATEIIVQCSQNKNKCFITVEDNGIGFDPELPNNKKGLGLINLKNRVKSMGGKLDINSDIEGTIVNIELNVG